MSTEAGEAFLRWVDRAVQTANVRSALIGGMAVNAWEEPRFTADVDLVVAADADGVARLVDLLYGEGFVLERGQEMDAPSGPDFVRMRHPTRGDSIDLQTAKTDYQVELLQRAFPMEGATLPVASPEDLIILKLIANRSKDLLDLDKLVARQDLDWPYIERWAETWQVTGLLTNLRSIAADRGI